MSAKGRHIFDKRCVECGRRMRSDGELCPRCARLEDMADTKPEAEKPDVTAVPENNDDAATMEFCLADKLTEPPEPVETILSERHYIGGSYERYMEAFSSLRGKKSRCGWNWSAFIFAPFWMIYRKLYLPGLLMLALCLAAVLPLWLLPPVYLLEGLFAGLFGDALVKRRVCRLIEKGRELTEPTRSQHIRKNGGVQPAAAGLLAALLIIACAVRIVIMLLPPPAPAVNKFCAQDGCYEWAVTGGEYCHDHTCLADSCLNKRQDGSQYCHEHMWMNNMCTEPGCQEEIVEGGMYCPEHTCMQEGCVAHRASGSEFCLMHTPNISDLSSE